jgi:hypothetical protein
MRARCRLQSSACIKAAALRHARDAWLFSNNFNSELLEWKQRCTVYAEEFPMLVKQVMTKNAVDSNEARKALQLLWATLLLDGSTGRLSQTVHINMEPQARA